MIKIDYRLVICDLCVVVLAFITMVMLGLMRPMLFSIFMSIASVLALLISVRMGRDRFAGILVLIISLAAWWGLALGVSD
ncbi:hypothetical protein [Maricaulis maris]|uniref:hypothetical protein n=1 Tax=Maricaulis maris TaxID=74318 RepID=UPI003B8D131F